MLATGRLCAVVASAATPDPPDLALPTAARAFRRSTRGPVRAEPSTASSTVIDKARSTRSRSSTRARLSRPRSATRSLSRSTGREWITAEIGEQCTDLFEDGRSSPGRDPPPQFWTEDRPPAEARPADGALGPFRSVPYTGTDVVVRAVSRALGATRSRRARRRTGRRRDGRRRRRLRGDRSGSPARRSGPAP